MKHIHTLLILSFLATFGIADEITGLNLRTTAGSQAVNPTAVAGAVLSLDSNKRPTFGGPLTFSSDGVATFAPTALSGSQATSALDIAQTWNTTGTPTAIKLLVTDTASNASSLLMDLGTVAGGSQFSVDKGGYIHTRGIVSPSILYLGSYGSQSAVGVYSGGDIRGNIIRGGLGNFSPCLQADGNNVFAQRSSTMPTDPQVFRIYNTYTSATAYERLAFDWQTTANTATIMTEKGSGGGTARDLRFGVGGIERQRVVYSEKTLTESTATIVCNVTVAAGKFIGGELIVTTHADDATDFQAITEHLTFSAVNKGGTVTATIQAAPSTSTTAASAGTLTTAWTAVANGNSVDIKNDAASSLTQTTLKCSYQLRLNTDDTVTVTP